MINKRTIAERFSGVPWHDSVIIAMIIERVGSKYVVRLILKSSMSFDATDELCVQFIGTRHILTDIDLTAFKLCSGMIWDADCFTDVTKASKQRFSALLELTTEKFDLEKAIIFEFTLVPPSGRFVLIAEDFQIITNKQSNYG